MARCAPALITLPLVGLLAACGGQSAGSSEPATTVAVSATDTACTPAASTVAAGPVTLAVTNEGTETTELYVYAADGSIVGEVEDVTPGLSRDLSVTLQAGTYTLACKPGERDPGVRTALTVR